MAEPTKPRSSHHSRTYTKKLVYKTFTIIMLDAGPPAFSVASAEVSQHARVAPLSEKPTRSVFKQLVSHHAPVSPAAAAALSSRTDMSTRGAALCCGRKEGKASGGSRSLDPAPGPGREKILLLFLARLRGRPNLSFILRFYGLGTETFDEPTGHPPGLSVNSLSCGRQNLMSVAARVQVTGLWRLHDFHPTACCFPRVHTAYIKASCMLRPAAASRWLERPL